MGDIGTHAEISNFVIDQVRRTVSDTDIPRADYSFLELGNFLTDVSQFRDPPAYHRARERARGKAGGFAGKIFLGSDPWVRDVFGQQAGPVHGAMPEMMRLLMAGVTHLVFDQDALPAIGAVVDTAGVHGPSILLSHGIAPDEVSAALHTNFTQYFPHEHLDSLPLPDGELRDHRRRAEFQLGRNSLLAYLDSYIDYLSEELTKLEQGWLQAHNKPGGITAADRRGMLLRLGHLLHAIEDYFFHSNLPELYAWPAAQPAPAPAQRPDRAQLARAALAQTRLDPTSVPLRRILSRRLRYPVYEENDKLSTTQSQDATDFVYTGGFGQTDVWHTLGGALEALEEQIARLPAAYDPRRTELVLFRLLLDRAAREAMDQGNTEDAQRKLHLEQLRKGLYENKIEELRAGRKLCPHAEAALLQAFALDKEISEKHAGFFIDLPGPGGVLILMMDALQRERSASAQARAGLDADGMSVVNLATDNGASAENIGTHTLMSKDATSKEPLRPEAVALAKHASATVARRLLTRVARPGPTNEGVDWDAELRYFVRGPLRGGWESEILAALQGARRFDQPDVTSVRDQPQFPLLVPTRNPQRLAARRVGGATARLEGYYRGMES